MEISLNEKISRQIAQSVHYDAIFSELEERSLLEEQVLRVQDLVYIDFLNEGEWKILTIMELFDKLTFEHCVETYLLAKRKIEKMLDDQVVLADLIEKADINLVSFYKACLFHDIGKIEIPSFVLNNTLNDFEWAENLCQIIHAGDKNNLKDIIVSNTKISEEDFKSEDALKESFEKNYIRAVSFVPIKMGLSKNEIEKLKERGFSEKVTLKKIVELHEAVSERILSDAGLKIEAKLAGQHHNYRHKRVKRLQVQLTTPLVSVNFNIPDILFLADVQQALEQERSYKKSFPKIKILAILATKAQEGFVGEYITYLWINDEIKIIQKEELKDKSLEYDMKTVKEFLKNYELNVRSA